MLQMAADLVGLGGASYWFTPDQVYLVTSWDDRRLWNTNAGAAGNQYPTIYAVRRHDRNHRRDATGDNAGGDNPTGTVDVSVLVSRYLPQTMPPDPAVPDQVQTLERMLADVLRLFSFQDSGLTAELVDDVGDAGGWDDTVMEDAPDGWVAGVLMFRVPYQYKSTAP